eukprot:contig_10283_g2463
MTKMSLRMRAEVAAAATTRSKVVPGSRMQRDAGGADERRAPVPADGGPGLAFTDPRDNTDGAADVGSEVDAGFDLETAAKKLQEMLDAERALCSGPDGDPPAGEDADEGAASPTESLTAVDLIGACQPFVEQAVSVAGGGEQTGSTGDRARDGGTPDGGNAGNGGSTAAAPVAGQRRAHASAATVDARALLSRVFDAAWYLADAKRVRARCCALQTAGTPRCLVLHSVRAKNGAARVPAAESDTYFASRPPGSRLGAWASDQSSPAADRGVMEARMAALEAEYYGPAGAAGGGEPIKDIPRPPHWGGYRLTPTLVEFWKGRKSRVHDRLCYKREAGGEGWTMTRLQP